MSIIKKRLTEEQLCEILQVSRVFIYRLRQRGMPFIRVGSRLIRYDLDDIFSWLDDKERGVEKNVKTRT